MNRARNTVIPKPFLFKPRYEQYDISPETIEQELLAYTAYNDMQTDRDI